MGTVQEPWAGHCALAVLIAELPNVLDWPALHLVPSMDNAHIPPPFWPTACGWEKTIKMLSRSTQTRDLPLEDDGSVG